MLIRNGTVVGHIKSQSLFIQIEVTHTRCLSSVDYKLLLSLSVSPRLPSSPPTISQRLRKSTEFKWDKS